MTDIDVRSTAPDEYRIASDTMRGALLYGPVPDEDWVQARPGWEDQRSITAWDGDRCVGNASAFRLRARVPGGAWLPTAGVSRIGILPTHTRRGLLTRLMTRLLHDVRADGDVLADLSASETMIYGRFGFGVANESTDVVVDTRRARPIRNTAPGSLRILHRDEILDLLPDLYLRIAGRPGAVDRPDFLWRYYLLDTLSGAQAGFVVVHSGLDGVDDGYAHYTVSWVEEACAEPVGTAEVHDLFGATPAVELALWDYVTGIDLVRTCHASRCPLDDPLRWAARDARSVQVKARKDEQWLRLLDVEAALAARTYRPSPAVVAIAVTDPLFEDNTDTFEVSADGVRRLGRGVGAELEVEIAELSAVYLGATSWQELAAAGRVHGSRDAIALADDLYAHRPLAWCGSFF